MSHIMFAGSMSPSKETGFIHLPSLRWEITLSFQMGDAELASGLWKNEQELCAGVRDMVDLYLFLVKQEVAGLPVFAHVGEDDQYGNAGQVIDLVGRIASIRSDRRLRPSMPEWEFKRFLATFTLCGGRLDAWNVLVDEEFRKDKHLVARRMLCAYVLARSACMAGNPVIGFPDGALCANWLRLLLRHAPRAPLASFFSHRTALDPWAKDICAHLGVLQYSS